MSVNVLYTTSATATPGLNGHSRTDSGTLDVKLTTPKELGGPGGPGNNPEELFAAGYAACFIATLEYVGSQMGQPVPSDANVQVTVGAGPRLAGGFGLTASLRVSLPGVTEETARRMIEEAHQACPYSNATRNNLDIQISLS